MIVPTPWYYGVTLAYYYHGPAAVLTVPPVAFLRYHRYDQLLPYFAEPDPMRPLMRQLRDVLRGGHQVWAISRETEFFGRDPRFVLPAADPAKTYDYNEFVWRAQVMHFLQAHADVFQPLALLDAQGRRPRTSGYEDPSLIRVSGWHD